MIGVITGDIIGSRCLEDQGQWMKPLKKYLKKIGIQTKQWEIYRGDSLQLETENITLLLEYALAIKALIKSIKIEKGKTNLISPLDMRIAIGIGEKVYQGDKVTENNGSAYVKSGVLLEQIKESKVNIALSSPLIELDEEINLYLKLALITMDDWTRNSAELMYVILNEPQLTQKEIGKKLGIGQNSVSGRYSRAHIEEMLLINEVFQRKITKFIDQ